MRFADAKTVHRLLDYPYLIDALEAAHRDAPPETGHILSGEPGGGDNAFVTLVAWKGGAGIAVKMVGVFPGNLRRDPPEASVQGLVALFDPETGGPRLVADGEAMTLRKTAADSGLGARLLAREDAATLLVLGAGGLAPHVIAAHRAARPSICRVLIWNRTAETARKLARSLGDIEAQATSDLDGALGEADIVSSVTMAKAPLISGAHLKPGAHVDLVGAYLPDMREADDAVMRRGTVFVDTRSGMEGSGELSEPVAAGAMAWEDVVADHFDLVQGRHGGRSSDDEITVCKNVGGGHLDLFTAIALGARMAEAA